MQACKPGFVSSTSGKGSYHLSGPGITTGINRPTHPAYCQGSFERATLFPDNIAGKSRTYLVFQPVRFSLPLMSPSTRWALTPPFHPYHNNNDYGGIFSVALSVSNNKVRTFLLGSTVLCVARTFLTND